MNLLTRLWTRLAPAAGESVQRATPAVACHDSGLPCMGCGWFDSSHELHTGLLVSEYDDEVAAAVLPLATWLDEQLADWYPDMHANAH